ncbi:MAG: Uma2 family endonuclease [Sumerlaeia bacterium]
MNVHVAELEKDPQLPRYVEHFQRLLERERVKREEFYRWLTPSTKAEFINGEVVMHSPSRRMHIVVLKQIFRIFDAYVECHGLGTVDVEKSLISLTRNDYEPDLCFWRAEVAAGFAPEQLQFPPPDLIVEVLSPSSVERDRAIKFDDYARHGVSEYWIVDPDAQEIEQYLLQDEAYVLQAKTGDGTLKSRVLAGLVFPARAAFDAEENAAALRSVRGG